MLISVLKWFRIWLIWIICLHKWFEPWKCSIFYQEGTFCETFHRDSTGWLECAVCLKVRLVHFNFYSVVFILKVYVEVRSVDLIFQKLHTNCIVSRSEVHFTLFGRLCCKVCATKLIRRWILAFRSYAFYKLKPMIQLPICLRCCCECYHSSVLASVTDTWYDIIWYDIFFHDSSLSIHYQSQGHQPI